jgi:hypothetical protein
MRDCPNAEMRDALPDLMHGTLSQDRQAEVRAHVDACEPCRRELELLVRVRGAVSAPVVSTDRIVASIPQYERPGSWSRLIGSPLLRVAAVVVLLAGGASLVLRDGERTPVIPSADSATRRGAPTELALGETFADVSDSALVALVEAIDDLEATLSEEPESIAVPLTPAGGL